MNRRVYVTFSGSVYDRITEKVMYGAELFGASEVLVYDSMWLMKQEFYTRNKWLWEHEPKRGFGWYAWKPFIILDALSRLSDGDVVLYTDADTYPIDNLNPLFETCERDGIMLFEVSAHMNRKWCKRDCYVTMGLDEEKYHNSKAGVARFILFQKGRWSPYQLLMEWLTYSLNPLALLLEPSVLKPELDGFVEHRCEQAILTLLAHKYGYKLYREADECGNAYPNDKELYGQLFVQENDWNDSNQGKNLTAPTLGSRFHNVLG